MNLCLTRLDFRPLVNLLALGTAVVIFGGCELVTGIGERTAYAEPVGGPDGSQDTSTGGEDSDSGLEDGGPDSESSPDPTLANCKLASTGAGNLRLGNVVPSADRVDFCLKLSSKASYADARPVFASAGSSCAWGLEYKSITSLLGFAPDTYDIKAVRAGSSSCDGPAVAELRSALVVEKQPAAVYLLGDGRKPPTLRRYVESRPSGVVTSTFRFLHAAPDLGRLDFGITRTAKLPTTMQNVRVKDIGFAETPAQSADIDENGYSTHQTAGGRFPYGIAPAGAPDAQLVVKRKVDTGSSYTFFASGRTDTVDFPLEMWACDENKATGILAECSDSPSVSLTVDTINVNLNGAFAIAQDARRPVALDAIAHLDSDVVCVTSLYADEDKEALIDQAKSRFPHSFYPKSTGYTPFDDAHDLNGDTPIWPPGPACNATAPVLNRYVDCLRDNCTAIKGSEDGVVIPTPGPCMADNCLSLGFELKTSPHEDAGNCLVCGLSQLIGFEKMSSIRSICTTEPTRHGIWTFRGNTGLVILSRYPIATPEFITLPSAGGWLTTLIRAPLTMDNGGLIDAYCTSASPTIQDCTFYPDTAPYYSGATDCKQGAANIQKLHFLQMRDYIARKSGVSKSRVVLSGAFFAGPAYKDKLVAQSPDNFSVLTNAFSIGISPGYEPECTWCAANPITTAPGNPVTGTNSWNQFHFLQNIAVTDVRANRIILTDPIVAADPGNGAKKIPISQDYGFRSVLRINP